MLVEDADQGKVVPCLICKQPIKVPTAPGKPLPPSVASPGEDLQPIFDDDEPQFKLD